MTHQISGPATSINVSYFLNKIIIIMLSNYIVRQGTLDAVLHSSRFACDASTALQ